MDSPVSSDGMIMRTSFKIRFEVTKAKWFTQKTDANQKLLTVSKLKTQDKQMSQVKRMIYKQFEKGQNSAKNYVEFPIHLMYDDDDGQFI